MATTSAQYATTVVSTAPGSGSWANTANALGSTSANFATWTAAASTSSSIVLGGFGLDALVPADATVNSLAVRTKHYVNSNTNISAASVLAQTAGGTVSTNPALTRSTTSTNVSTNTLTGVTRAHLADLRISLRYQHANNTTSATANVDWVEVVVDYSPAQAATNVGGLASTLAFGDVAVAVAVAPSGATTRQNLVRNPSFEQNISDTWNQFGMESGTHARDTASTVIGSASLRLTRTTAGDSGEWTNIGTLAPGTWTASCWMRTDSTGNAAFTVRRPAPDYSTIGTEVHVSGTTGWTRRSITFTLTAATDVDVVLGLGSYGATSTGTAWYDALLVEQASAVGDYFDGGYSARGGQTSWSGAPHNSASTETYTETVSAAVPSLGPSLAFGNVAATAGPVSVAVPSMASALALGPVTASASVVVAPAPLASTLAFGPVTASPGPVAVAVASRASTLAFGAVAATASAVVAPAPLASTLTFGPVGISGSARAEVSSRPSSLVFGAVTTSTSASVTPISIASSLALGNVSVTATANVAMSPVASTLVFGPVATSASVSALVDGVPGPLVTFGAVAVSATATVAPASLTSTLALGPASASARAVVAPTSLASSLAFGPAAASPGPVSVPVPSLGPLARFGPVTAAPIETLATTPTSLASTLACGAAGLTPGPVTSAVPSRGSTLAFGAVTASSTATTSVSSRPSTLAFGPTTATSTAAVTPASLASALALGPVTASPGQVAALVPSRGTTLAFGGTSLAPGAVATQVASRVSALAFGPVTAAAGPVFVAMSSRVSTLAFGAVATSTSALVASTPLASTLAFGSVSISASAQVEVPSLQAPLAAFTITLSPGEVVVVVESLLSALAFGGIASTQRRNLDVRVGPPRLSPWLTARPPVTTGRPHGALATTRPTI